MSAPVLWVFVPIALGVALWWLHTRTGLTSLIASLASAGLAALAWLLPLGVPLRFGPLSLQVDPSFVVLGRSLTIETGDLPFLVVLFLLAAVWFLASRAAGANPVFVPLALILMGLLVAALAVEPFLYAALFIEMAVLFSIPFLAPPGQPARLGVIRYLIFQTLGMPFLLFTGWVLTGVEAGSSDILQVVRAAVLLGFGFAFLLAVFPFHSWIPLLLEQSRPFETGFILSVLPTVILMFGLTFLDRYAWLRDSPDLYSGLRVVGTLMIVTGGVWAAFQKHLGRIFAYAVVVETGFFLLAVSLPLGQGSRLFAMLLLPRLVALGVWTLGLSILDRRVNSLSFDAVRGCFRSVPLASIALLAANFSIAGLPLLAEFPVKQAVIEAAAIESSGLAVWVMLGSLGLLTGGLRSMAVLLGGAVHEKIRIRWEENRFQRILLGFGLLFLILFGLFPQFFLPGMLQILSHFTHLA